MGAGCACDALVRAAARRRCDGTTSGSTTAGTDPSATTTTTAVDTSESSAAASESSSTTGAAPDPCREMQPPCTGECVRASLYAFDDSVSCAADPVTACISGAYDPRATSGRTFHRDGAFVLVGTPCGDAVAPDGWDECLLDGQDQPEGCACLCREGVCPGDEDRVALAACEVTELCPHLDVEVFAPDEPETIACILTALRDRTPGMVSATYATGFIFEDAIAYLDGSDTALSVRASGDDFVICPDDASAWTDAERCTLAAPAVFDDCLAQTDSELLAQCFVASMTWFAACRPAEPICP
jgi:hypothetical protein